MKKNLLIFIMALLATLCCAFGFTACWGNSDGGTTDNGDNTEQGDGQDNNKKPDGDTSQIKRVESISLNTNSHTLTIGDTYTLTAKVLPDDATDKSVEWSSSNIDAVTVINGKLTAISEGEATITVKTNDGNKTAQCYITVKKATVHVNSVSLDETALTLRYGDEVTLKATILPADADNKDVEWSSSDESIATVSNGKVTAVDSGKAVITATAKDGNKSAQCEVTVKGLKFAETSIGNGSAAYSVIGIGTITDNEIEIPDTYKGKPVTAIGQFAFSGCTNITAINIPDTVNYIGAHAFDNCKISKAIIPSTVITFIPHTYLTTVEITSGNHIEPNAFKDCTTLTSVTVCDSLQHIGDYAFSGCTNLTNLTVGSGLKSFGDYALENCDKLQLKEYNNALYLGNASSPYSVLVKAKNTTITSCNINENTKLIYGLAFDGCTSLVNLTVPDSIIFVGTSAFNNCTSLKYTEYHHTNYLGNSKNPYVIMKGFIDYHYVSIPHEKTKIICDHVYHNDSVTYFSDLVIIPDGVTCIGKNAFYNSEGTGNITSIPDSVTYIGVAAFGQPDNRSSLKGISIPKNLTYICDSTFYKNNKLTDVTLPDGVSYIGKNAFSACTTLENVVIPNSVISIGNEAFYNCSALKSVNIPDGVTTVGATAFYNCSALESVKIGNSLISIGERAFNGCGKLSEINIPDCVESIGALAFSNCTNLIKTENGVQYVDKWAVGCDESATNITLKSDTKGIVNRSLSSYDQLESITIPDSVTFISYGAFATNAALKYVNIPDSITYIDSRAFFNCKALTSIKIPGSVTYLGESVFRLCKELTSITFEGTMEQWNAIEKGLNWDISTGEYTIHCTDGDIAKVQN